MDFILNCHNFILIFSFENQQEILWRERKKWGKTEEFSPPFLRIKLQEWGCRGFLLNNLKKEVKKEAKKNSVLVLFGVYND